jgi:hypothetical protein
MHLLICTRTDAFVVSDRCGTLLESVRRFFKVLTRFYPEAILENCEWRSSLANWPEVDAFLSIPRDSESTMTAVLEVFVHYFLESAHVKKRVRIGASPLDLALEFRKGTAGNLRLTPQRSLIFNDQEIFAVIRGESLYPVCESVESLYRRKFQGLACRVIGSIKENHESTKDENSKKDS